MSDGPVTYVEPFAGGAGAAMNLLRDSVVSKVILNDLDVRVYSVWRAMIEENERFCEQLSEVSIDIDLWWKCRAIVNNPPDTYSFETGFATFIINRTSRSGILLGSGPIGGYKQEGKWKIDARFYRETMLRRVKWIGDHAEQIEIKRIGALKLLESCIENADIDLNRTLFFIDPPYVGAGSRLYFNGMTEDDHTLLSLLLQKDILPNWVLTYDNDPLIEKLYSKRDQNLLEVGYSLAKVRSENEILISTI